MDETEAAAIAAIKHEIQSTSDAVVLGSLRKHLWHALVSEDGDAALCVLKATRADWEAWKLKDILLKNSSNVKQNLSKRRLFSKKQRKTDEATHAPAAVVTLTPTGIGPGLLQMHLNPTEPFALNDYRDFSDDQIVSSTILSQLTTPAAASKQRNISKRASPRQAFAWARHGRVTESNSFDQDMPDASKAVPADYLMSHSNMTTPLHEAARLGHLGLVECILQNPLLDVNARDGMGRTPLIMVAGGVAGRECIEYDGDGSSSEITDDSGAEAGAGPTVLGIRKPQPVPLPAPPEDLQAISETSAKKATRAVRSFLRNTSERFKHHKSEEQSLATNQICISQQSTLRQDSSLSNKLADSRIATAIAIINYSHPDDGTERSGQGPSMNSVDTILGRTALHYAAELGRTQVCQAIANSFGTMLTVVDDLSQTPMELAGRRNHKELAAYLEARALLYIDPYGMDEELLAAVEQRQQREQRKINKSGDSSEHQQQYLALPFAWYETWSMVQVQTERSARLDRCLEAMRRVTRAKVQSEEARKNILVAADALQGEMPWLLDAVKRDDDESSDEDNDAKDKLPVAVNDSEEITAIETASKLINDSCETSSVPASGADDQSQKPAVIEHVSETFDEADGRLTDQDDVISPRSILGQLESEDHLISGEDDALSDTEAGEEDDDIDSSAAVNLPKIDADDVDSKKINLIASRTDYEVFDSIHKTHAELYLKHHKWDEKVAMKAFEEDPFTSFIEAGIHVPCGAVTFSVDLETENDAVTHESICLICCDEFEAQAPEFRRLTGCHHSFCSDCLGEFLSQCSSTRSTGLAILCPHHECSAPLSPVEIAELAPSLDVYESLLKAANEDFIATALDFRYCPHPGCEGIVKFNVPSFITSSDLNPNLLETVGAVCTEACVDHEGPCTYEGMSDANYCNAKSATQPSMAHRFCFSCGEGNVHWPCPCDRLEEWKAVIEERVNEAREEGEDVEKHDDIAQKLWLKTNTRPCPKCKAPIQKNEGCNHMTCSNPQCKFEFCWICRNDWKLHSSETGGFFRCNRWVEQKEHDAYDEAPTDTDAALTALQEAITDPHAMANTYGTAMHASRTLHKKSRDVARFIHHYQRWSAHAESCALEQRMSETVCTRLAPVILEAIKYSGKPFFNFGGGGISFLHSAFVELKECRIMLQHSYAFSFYRYKGGSKYYKQMKRRLNEKAAFEQMQSELELLTEQMSDVVARAHLRATQSQILFLTASAAERRGEFTKLMVEILHKERKESTHSKSKIDSRRLTGQNERNVSSAANIFDALANAARSDVRLVLAPQVDTDDDDDLEEAIRASLRDFRSADNAFIDDLDSAAEPRDWSCATCTYVNSVGRSCSMCGTRQQ